MADTPFDELMGSPINSNSARRDDLLDDDDDPIITSSTGRGSSTSRMPSRWAQYEADPEILRQDSYEANARAMDMAVDKVANSPPREPTLRLPSDYESDDGSAEYGGDDDYENDEAIRAEALKMLELADDHLSTPYSVRKTQSGGFSASYSGGFRGMSGSGYSDHGSRRSSTSTSSRASTGRVPKALAGLDFTKPRAFSPRSSYSTNDDMRYAEEDSLVDVEGMENGNGARSKPENKWSSRYSIDHTLLALSGSRSSKGDVKGVLDRMDRETDRERRTARNMLGESPRIFGSAGFSFRDSHVFGKQNAKNTDPAIHSNTNLKTAWRDDALNSNGKSLTPPEPRKTWQEQVERKKRQQRRLALGAIGICAIIAIIIGVSVSKSGGNDSKKAMVSAYGSSQDRGAPKVVFYVTSDSPYDSDDEQKLTADLLALPSDAQFVVHLGNIQDSAVTLCSESRYSRVKDVLMQSPVPMFILPGEEDWNNCPNPEDAWETWQDTFRAFESNFDHNLDVSRQLKRKENFAVAYNEILFLGFHLVGGRINSEEEWDDRLEDNIEWMESMVTMNAGGYRYIVLFGNARPSPQQRKFFDRMSNFLGGNDVPIIYIHANSGVGGVMHYQLFGGNEGIEGLQIEDGGQNPPLRISVYDDEAPFVVG